MPGVLFLDIATATGWALWEGASRVRHGTYSIPGGRMGRRLRHFAFWLDGMLTVNQVGHLAIEAPLLRGDGKTNIDTIRLLHGLVSAAHIAAEGRDVGLVEEANIGTIRAHFIGTAHGKRAELKAKTMAICSALGWQPKNDNEGDALAGLHFTLHKHRYPHGLASTMLFARRPAA